MQMLAAYDAARRTGLYLALHDPRAATKDLRVESRPGQASVVLAFEHPAPQMDAPGNDFSLERRGRLANRPRRLVRRGPDLSPVGPRPGPAGRRRSGRTAAPTRRPGCASCRCGPRPAAARTTSCGRSKPSPTSSACPVGVHWYSWHEIPFDNDYPHYFPAKPGFAEAVARLQQRPIYVMPYINGRLWDTRDHGVEDQQFSRVARPAATKDEAGQPYVESYGSKESDGSRVRLAVMCPTTEVWRRQAARDRPRLTGQCGVKAVYIDQVAAARPQLCFDRSARPPDGRRQLVDGGLLGHAEDAARQAAGRPRVDDRVQRRGLCARVRRLADLALAVRRPGARLPRRLRRPRRRCSAAPIAAVRPRTWRCG